MTDQIKVSGARPGYHLNTPKGNPVPAEPSKVALSKTEIEIFESWGIKTDPHYGGNQYSYRKEEV